MDLPVNHFKRRLIAGEKQIGLWLNIADPAVTEICAGAGFDWLCIDAEHSLIDIRDIFAQLQAAAPYPISMLVRLASDDRVHIKQHLDLGVQTIVVPMIETAEQARALVAATRYAPEGTRGLSNMTRAGRWGRVGPFPRAHEEICVIAQIETARALGYIEAIASVPGLDALFIGPGDLSASLGMIGEPQHPDARAAMDDAVKRTLAIGKRIGMFGLDDAMAKHFLALGCTFVSVGSDARILARETTATAQRFRD